MATDDTIIAMTERAVLDEFDAGRMRPEWTWLAIDGENRIIGRALWWGRDHTAPIALDVFDAEGLVDSRADVAAALLRVGHDGLALSGFRLPLPHTVRLRGDWRSHPASVDAVAWRQVAATEAGLTRVNERLQFEWRPDVEPPPTPTRLTLRPGSDEEFLRLFGEVARGSLDVGTHRTLTVSTLDQLSRDELDFYRSCPGDRAWWRVATDSSDARVGLVIPSATPHSVNVGYLGVLPEHRGRGYVNELLAYVTTFHHAAGAKRITATTDASNFPMAAAFVRHGYRNVEVRLDLEASPEA